MKDIGVPLRSILSAFQGVIPSPVATVSSDGTPNVTYVSVVRLLDDERVAISNQFLAKTVDNLAANPSLSVRVVEPDSLLEYDLGATWLRSERTGELFDSMRAQVDAIAELTGMSGIFRLRSVEVLRVEDCCLVEGSVGRPSKHKPAAAGVEAIRIFMRSLDECRDLADLTETALELLHRVCGMSSSVLLFTDDGERSLFVVAHHGSASGAAAEIAVGEGVIGVAAERRQQILIPHVGRARTMNRAAAQSRSVDPHEIGLPGIEHAQSLVATPIMRGGHLLGVLYVDSAEPGRFGSADGELLEVIAHHLGMRLDLLNQDIEEIVTDHQTAAAPGRGPTRSISFNQHDGTLLIDGDYVIRGVAGRILFAMLSEHQRSGRVRFSNRELRMNRELGLPAGNDNLDARLVSLRRRLAERGDPIALERVGRGQLELRVEQPLALIRVDPRNLPTLA
ncbi:MAG: GAF domain-containing protein [Acidimicrobiales bacterium]